MSPPLLRNRPGLEGFRSAAGRGAGKAPTTAPSRRRTTATLKKHPRKAGVNALVISVQTRGVMVMARRLVVG